MSATTPCSCSTCLTERLGSFAALYQEIEEFCGGKGGTRGKCSKEKHKSDASHAQAASARLKDAQAKHDSKGTAESAATLEKAKGEHAQLSAAATASAQEHATATQGKADALTATRSAHMKQVWQKWRAAKAAADASEKAAKKQQILGILARKADAALESSSEDELRGLLASL